MTMNKVEFIYLVHGHLAVVFGINDHNGSQRAGAHTVNGFERKLSIVRHFTRFDAQRAFELVLEGGRTADMAGSALADSDYIFAARFQTKGGVKRGRFIH